MESFYERTIEDLIEVLKRAKNDKANDKIRVNLLIGAGASVTGDIPLAQEIIKDIEKKFPREYARAGEKTYAECMSILTSLERRNLISTYVNNAKINWAHLLIAHLMKNKIINTVLTTNFDNLLIRACAIENSIPGVYDLAASSSFRPELLYENAIIYLHGQHTGFVLCNTENELEKQMNNIEPTFIELNKNSMWIVVGYSGENDPIVKLFHKYKNSDNRLYWIGYNDNEPTEDVKLLLEDKERYCYHISGYDADSFFVNLCRGLGKYPPDIINEPFTYLYNIIKTITEYVDKEIPFINKESYTSITKDIVKRAIDDYEGNKVIMANYYFRLKMLDKYKDIIEIASPEEKAEIDMLTSEKNSKEEIISGTIKYIDSLENNSSEFNFPNLDLAIIVVLAFFEKDKKLEYLSKLLSILDNKKNNNIETEEYILLRMNIQKSLYIIDRNVERLNTMLEELESFNSKDINEEAYILIKIDILESLGDYYLNEKNQLSIKYFDDALKYIYENEKNLNNTLYNFLIGKIYINKMFYSKENFIDLGGAFNCFNNVINAYLNNKIESDDENQIKVDNIVESLYRLIIIYDDLDYQKHIISWIEDKFKNVKSNYIIISYLEGVNNIVYDVENFDKKFILVQSIFNIISSFDVNDFDKKEKNDVSILLNQIAYILIENQEREFSKLILDLSIRTYKNPFNVATQGFYELRINGDLELGVKFYDEASNMECDINLRRALEQKKYIEIANYNLNLENNLEAELAIDNAIKIGEINESWKSLFEEAIKFKEECIL